MNTEAPTKLVEVITWEEAERRFPESSAKWDVMSHSKDLNGVLKVMNFEGSPTLCWYDVECKKTGCHCCAFTGSEWVMKQPPETTTGEAADE